jgi:YegS/Rv2252/BmrU family lipid kinase
MDNATELGTRMAVVVNPVAGGLRRRHRFDRALARLVAGGVEVVVRETTRPGHAGALARAARDDPAIAAIIVAGGDGTINEAINGLDGAGRPLPLGLLPFGTANVLAHELGVGADLGRAVATLLGGHRRSTRLGRCGQRRFALMAGVGFDAHVVATVDPGLKRRFGKLAYVWASAARFTDWRARHYEVTADLGDAGTRRWSAASVVVAKSRFYGGRFVLTPDADLGRPSLEMCRFERGSRWAVLRYGGAMMLDLLPRLPDAPVATIRRVTIEGPPGEPVQADGDLVGELPVTIDLAPEAIDWLAPRAVAT